MKPLERSHLLLIDGAQIYYVNSVLVSAKKDEVKDVREKVRWLRTVEKARVLITCRDKNKLEGPNDLFTCYLKIKRIVLDNS